jgi:hypothetical protein
MKKKLLIALFLAVLAIAVPVHRTLSEERIVSPVAKTEVLAERHMSLNNRYPVKSVSDVFKDNILLSLAYVSGKVKRPADIKWDKVTANSRYEMVLQPGEVFAFHDDVLPQYKGKKLKTVTADFGAADGYKTDGYLYGDGVCHFASLIHWAAQDAGLKVVSPVNHDFAHIPEVPREYGTSIYTTEAPSYTSEMQNLYVENTFDTPVKIVIEYTDPILKVTVEK